MIHKKRIQALGLACLVGLHVSLGSRPPESLAAVSWTKNNGVYIQAATAHPLPELSPEVSTFHTGSRLLTGKPSQATDVQFVMLGTRYDNAVDPYFKTNADAAAAAGLEVWALLVTVLMPLQLTWRFRKQILFLI